MLGPGWFPVDISVLWEGEPELLGDLNLSKLGLRAVSTVTDNSSNTASGNVVVLHTLLINVVVKKMYSKYFLEAYPGTVWVG